MFNKSLILLVFLQIIQVNLAQKVQDTDLKKQLDQIKDELLLQLRSKRIKIDQANFNF